MAFVTRRLFSAALHAKSTSKFALPAFSSLPPPRKTLFTSSALRKDDDDEGGNMDQLKENPYYGKYANKIAKLQKTSPEEFLKRLAEYEEQKKKGSTEQSGESPSSSSSSGQERGFSLPSKPKSDDVASGGSINMARQKKLSDLMRTDLMADKSADEIAEIWRQYHSTRDAVAAVIPAETYEKMQQRFKEFKTFLFPLPRKDGYEFIVVQFEGNEAHFTTLVNYQAFEANAPECLTLIHYPEFAQEKGIVLMVGEFDTNVMSVQEAQCLANEVELYYASPSEERVRLLRTFTEKPAEFKHMDLVAQMESAASLLGSSSKSAAAADKK